MLIYEHFRYTGSKDRWTVPEGVTEALFECWGAAGGMPSDLSWQGKKTQVVGGNGPRNVYFYNAPNSQGQLGHSYANNAGYARGKRTVSEGEVFWVFVGGNGAPGHSTIKLTQAGNLTVTLRGGAGGYNGGGNGGEGALITQNLYNSKSTKVHYKKATMPNSAKSGQLWHDTANDLVKKCNTTYTSGNGSDSKWDQVTHVHDGAVGPSGGGGGGATDIRHNGDDVSDRILVAGGGGGAGGTYSATGPDSWTLRAVPTTPAPPYGNDGLTASGPDYTWAVQIDYLVGGWGRGGLGGGSGPAPASHATIDGGVATTGGAGGPGTNRHKDGDSPSTVHGSGGDGGTNDSGGKKGTGGSGGQDGSKAAGGNGASALGNHDDWCAGGGGGGGGFYGGGGGGQGFKVTGKSASGSDTRTYAGGGGGGSNYADPTFTHVFLGGAARPPFAKGNSGTGANGHGGFARISYNLPPTVKWKSIPRAVVGGNTFDASFTFRPARTNGSKIDHYIIGTSTVSSDTAPTSETTFTVNDSSQTVFTAEFVAPPVGSTYAYFVRVVDKDGDASDWLKQTVKGISATVVTTATITAPAANSTFEEVATVNWTLGSQTPLAAYRLGVTGTTPTTSHGSAPVAGGSVTDWRRGGSRVNLAIDPGFETASVWSSDNNTDLANHATHGGVSGSSGFIAWTQTDDFDAENHTTVNDGFVPGTTYRLHLGVASAYANDPRPVEVQVWDDDGLVTSTAVDLSAEAAFGYVFIDLPFTPHTQNVYFAVLPSGSGIDDTVAWLSEDFEDGTVDGWTAEAGYTVAADGTETYQGDFALKVSGFGTEPGATKDITALLTNGAGTYVLQGWGFSPAASDHDAALGVAGTGVNGGVGVTASTSTRDAMTFIRMPFIWDGTGTVLVYADGALAATHDLFYDLIEVYSFDEDSEPDFGNTDNGQQTFLSDMLVELLYEDDDLPAYFDGSHLNGLTGTVSWSGAANASPSFLTGADVLTDTVAYSGSPLVNSSIFLDTLTEDAIVDGQDPVRASVAVKVNPTPPATPTVTLTVGNLMVLTINAADGAETSALKTVSFDVFRNGVRVATGLIPDQTTREATFTDAPASGEATTYIVRAWNASGGYADQTDGTVN